MSFFEQIFAALKLGGAMIYPLSLLFILALALIFDKILFYKKLTILPKKLPQLIFSDEFSWNDLKEEILSLDGKNIYRIFFESILKNKSKPIWFLESQTENEVKLVEKNLAQNLWILETIVTAAPLLGLLGTIIGMMSSFKLMGKDSLLNPHAITGGVAEALIATAFGLGIAIIALFAFNYFSKRQDQTLDELELLGTKIVDQIKLQQK